MVDLGTFWLGNCFGYFFQNLGNFFRASGHTVGLECLSVFGQQFKSKSIATKLETFLKLNLKQI